MGAVTYYSPFFIGIIFTFLRREVVLDSWTTAGGSAETAWIWFTTIACRNAVFAQFLLIGAQGVLAQVLPVPIGRSIRGRTAAWIGAQIIITIACAIAAGLFHSEERLWLYWTFLGIGGVTLAIAALLYIWNLPTAIRDFDRALPPRPE